MQKRSRSLSWSVQGPISSREALLMLVISSVAAQEVEAIAIRHTYFVNNILCISKTTEKQKVECVIKLSYFTLLFLSTVISLKPSEHMSNNFIECFGFHISYIQQMIFYIPTKSFVLGYCLVCPIFLAFDRQVLIHCVHPVPPLKLVLLQSFDIYLVSVPEQLFLKYHFIVQSNI